MHAPNETTACRLTGDLPSAICVIHLRGSNAKSWLEKFWVPANGRIELQIDAIRYGQLRFDGPVGESVVVCRTDQDSYEIHCHGGDMAAHTILDRMAVEGIRIDSQANWCDQQGHDPIEYEATMALLQAKSLKTACILMDQKHGAIRRAWEAIDVALAANDRPMAEQLADDIRVWNSLGSHLIEPYEIVLCGPPNVGKSSLMNRILGYQRSIVHEQAGTTRDLLTEESNLDGWPVRIKDSAGIRSTNDGIEQEGVLRAVQASASADLQLLLVDPAEGWTQEHQQLFDLKPRQSLIVLTKSDILEGQKFPDAPWKQLNAGCISVSSLTGHGIEDLLSAIAKKLVPSEPPSGQAILFNEKLREGLESKFRR